MHLLRVTAAALAALAVAAPAAAAAGFRSLGQIDDQPSASFGELAWRSGGDTVHYRDSRTGRERRFASACLVFGVDDGRVLLGCERFRPLYAPYVADAATGRVDPVPGGDPSDLDLGLGAHWLLGIHCTPNRPDVCSSVSLNRHTGERVTYAVDADRPEPVRSSPEPSRARLAGPASRDPQERGPLLLRRRGRADVVLSRCRGGCREAQYSFGRAFWLQGGRFHTYDPATGRRRSARVPARARGALELRLNGHEAALVARPGGAGSRTGELFVAPWPRRYAAAVRSTTPTSTRTARTPAPAPRSVLAAALQETCSASTRAGADPRGADVVHDPCSGST